MTALSLIQDACGELGLAQPSGSLYSSTDPLVQQLASLANREGKDLARRKNWAALTRQASFTTVAQELQTSFIPSDLDRFVTDSMWNTSTVRKVFGPMTPQEYERYQAYPIFTSVNPAAIIFNNGSGQQFYLQPAPAAGQTIQYFYVMTTWAQATGGGALKAAFSADTDVALIPETLITLGIKWRYKMAKGFDYSQDKQIYEQQVEQFASRDGGGAPVLNLNYGLGRFTYRPYNVPEGSWP